MHGDNGGGPGASHQAGWTGLVGKLAEIFGQVVPQQFLNHVSQISRMANQRCSEPRKLY